MRGEIDDVKSVMVANIGTLRSLPPFLCSLLPFILISLAPASDYSINKLIEKVLERGEKIELLVEQTEALQHNAFEFKKGSTQLKRAMWWKNMKITIILILVVLVLSFFPNFFSSFRFLIFDF